MSTWQLPQCMHWKHFGAMKGVKGTLQQIAAVQTAAVPKLRLPCRETSLTCKFLSACFILLVGTLAEEAAHLRQRHQSCKCQYITVVTLAESSHVHVWLRRHHSCLHTTAIHEPCLSALYSLCDTDIVSVSVEAVQHLASALELANFVISCIAAKAMYSVNVDA